MMNAAERADRYSGTNHCLLGLTAGRWPELEQFGESLNGDENEGP